MHAGSWYEGQLPPPFPLLRQTAPFSLGVARVTSDRALLRQKALASAWVASRHFLKFGFMDLQSSLLLGRCMQYAREGIPKGWEGTTCLGVWAPRLFA